MITTKAQPKIFGDVGLVRGRQTVCGIILNSSPNQGLTLFELLVAIAFGVMSRLLAWSRLNIATFQLSQQWKAIRYEATGRGAEPTSVCMAELMPEQIQYTQIQGSNCEMAAQWLFLPEGISIDKNNSTLPTVSGVAGNGGKYYRASWADTQGGLGGSWGQLGRIVLNSPEISLKRCLFLFKVHGSWNIRDNESCNK